MILVNGSNYLGIQKESEEYRVTLEELKSIYLHVSPEDTVIIDTYDEIVLFILANRVGSKGSIVLGEHIENKEELYRFAVINDIWGIINMAEDSIRDAKHIFTIPERINFYGGSIKIYAQRSETTGKLEERCKSLVDSIFSRWYLC